MLISFIVQFVEEQAIDRVHRLNQTVDVVVYKLTVAHTVEERIIDLQDKKRQLAEQAIDTGAKKGALKLGLNELIDLFKPGTHLNNGAGGGLESYHEDAGEQQFQRAQSAMRFGMKKQPPKRQENAVFGRRW